MAEMPDETATTADKVELPRRLDERIGVWLKRFQANARERARLQANYNRTVAAAKQRLKAGTGKLDADDGVISAAIAKIVYGDHGEFLSRYGRELFYKGVGVLKINTIGESVEMPRTPRGLIEFLLARKGGKKYLRQVWEVDKDALKSASPKLKAILRKRFKVWIGPHKSITVQLEGDDKPTQIHHRRIRQLPKNKGR